MDVRDYACLCAYKILLLLKWILNSCNQSRSRASEKYVQSFSVLVKDTIFMIFSLLPVIVVSERSAYFWAWISYVVPGTWSRYWYFCLLYR